MSKNSPRQQVLKVIANPSLLLFVVLLCLVLTIPLTGTSPPQAKHRLNNESYHPCNLRYLRSKRVTCIVRRS